jgi:hypothetical protein
MSDLPVPSSSFPDIHSLLLNKDYESAVEILRTSMKATRIVKGPHQSVAEVPDHSIRLKAASLILAYGFGTPTTRSELSLTDSRTGDANMTPAQLMDKITNSGVDLRSVLGTYIESLPIANEHP